jgi:hypothetical protein
VITIEGATGPNGIGERSGDALTDAVRVMAASTPPATAHSMVRRSMYGMRPLFPGGSSRSIGVERISTDRQLGDKFREIPSPKASILIDMIAGFNQQFR